MLEFRKIIRSYANLNVKYKSKEPFIERKTLSKSIGTAGINIFTTEKLEKDAILELEIEIPENHKIIFATGKVNWQTKLSYSGKSKKIYFSTGIEITKIDTADKEKIARFVWGSLNKNSLERNEEIIDKLEILSQK